MPNAETHIQLRRTDERQRKLASIAGYLEGVGANHADPDIIDWALTIAAEEAGKRLEMINAGKLPTRQTLERLHINVSVKWDQFRHWERANLAQSGTGQIRMSAISTASADIPLESGNVLSIGISEIPPRLAEAYIGELAQTLGKASLYQIGEFGDVYDPETNEETGFIRGEDVILLGAVQIAPRCWYFE